MSRNVGGGRRIGATKADAPKHRLGDTTPTELTALTDALLDVFPKGPRALVTQDAAMLMQALERHGYRLAAERAARAEPGRDVELRRALVEAVLPLEVIAAQDRAKPYLELSRDLIEDIRALGHLTPEDWDERRGGDPIARTVNAVEDIIQARFDEARSMAEERVREAHAGSQSARSSAALRSSAAGLDAGLLMQANSAAFKHFGGHPWWPPTQDFTEFALAEYARLAAPQAAPKTQEEAGG